MANTKIKKSNGLVELIKTDENLSKDPDLRMSYISLAEVFMEDFANNINCTSIEMDAKQPFGIDTWKDFLNYPVVRKYIKSFKDEQIDKIADAGLMSGNKNAIDIKKAMENKGPAINNSNLIIVRLPEKVDYD